MSFRCNEPNVIATSGIAAPEDAVLTATLRVDTTAVQQAAAQLEMVSGQVEETIPQLSSIVDSVQDEIAHRPTGAAFDAAWQRERLSNAALAADFRAVATALKLTADGFAGADGDAAGSFSGGVGVPVVISSRPQPDSGGVGVGAPVVVASTAQPRSSAAA